MRILAIRGANLASLADPFVLDFEAQPLLSSGLFAITGETGAGKSTLLDALCLALFDKFPRVVSAGGGEGAPDASGETLTSGDPRIILRRGASAGYAEVDFVARDGQRYRARCDLLRARGNAAGRLQNRLRSLWRLDTVGSSLQTIETGIEPVNRRIIELTDLTFDQFRRTALLSQGDFDAFLRADARERAELLEKITGVEIYAKLSQRVFEEAREAQARVQVLENKRAEVGVLAEEARAETLREVAKTLELRQQCEGSYLETQNSLRQLDLFDQAQRRLILAQQAQEEARRGLEVLEPKIAYLEKRQRFEPLRLIYLKAKEAEDLTLKLEEQAEALKVQLGAAQESHSKLAEEEATAQQHFAEINIKHQRFSPLWLEASRLDVAIKTLTPGALEARGAINNRIKKLEENRCALAQSAQRRLDLFSERSKLTEELAAFVDISQLCEQLEEIERRLDARQTLLTENQETLAQIHLLQEQIAGYESDREQLEVSQGHALAQRDQFLHEIHNYERILDEKGVDVAEERFRESLEKISKVNTLLELAAQFLETTKQKKTIEELRTKLEIQSTGIFEKLTKLKERQERQVLEDMEARRLGDLAEAMNAPETMRLRASLRPDCACPVCGSHEHVFAHEESAAQQLVAALRAKREAMLQVITQTGADVITLSAEESALRAECLALQRQEDDLSTKITNSQRDFQNIFRSACVGLAPIEIDQSLAPLKILQDGFLKTHAQLEQNFKSVKDFLRLRDKLRGSLNSVNLTLAQIQEACAHLSEKKNLGRVEELRLSQLFSSNKDRVAELDLYLTPILQACGLSEQEIQHEPMRVRQVLKNKAGRLLALRHASDACDRELFSLDLEISHHEAQKIELSQDLSLAEQLCKEKENALQVLKEQRFAVFSDEDVAINRREIEADQRAAKEKCDLFRIQLNELDKNIALIDMQYMESLNKLVTARKQQHDLGSNLRSSLIKSDLEELLVRRILEDDEEFLHIQDLVAAAKEALAMTKSTRMARYNDVQDIQKLLAPGLSRDLLLERSEGLKQQIDACSVRVGALRQLIETDDLARTRVCDINKDISLAATKRQIWDEINEAIGSKSGDKFRRFAQSMTLEHLIVLANQRLMYFTSRYVLEKSSEVDGLGIHVIDRDLGDERRSTRSLSGGERFLVSLALALALAGLEGRNSFIDTLFIDEGFGSLDGATLDIAIDALENLQGQGRRVGVISHVEALQQRIATKICVERRGGGRSVVRVEGML